MTQRLLPLTCVAMLILAAFLTPALAQDDNESPDHFAGVWYKIVIDSEGNRIDGEGDGSGWYHYPENDVHRMWFYNGPYDPTRKGYMDYHVYTKAVDPTKVTQVVAYFGWTTPEWSALKQGRPPLPEDVPTSNEENMYISGSRVYSVDGVITGSAETIHSYSVEDYNPEWVCIEIKARNAYIYRGAFHECAPKGSRMGACCNRQTGYCYMTFEESCTAPLEWLGIQSTCDQCTRTGTTGTDFGDAPDQNYRTLLANNGARHGIVPGIFLGGTVDGESNGQPDATASGDDRNGVDEDGVVFTSILIVGQAANVEVAASTEGYLNAWVDFDGNGAFDERADKIFADQMLSRGINRLTFAVPADAVPGETFARFRFNTRGLLDSFGPADDGEVEDYRVQIVASHDPQAVSGASRLAWSQPPSAAADQGPHVFQTGGVSSSLHLHEMAADDWRPVSDQPVTGIHWWGTFDRWTESFLPPDLPLAFHIGIWTNVPDPEPYNFTTFAHPGTLVWETYCTNWTWAVSGREVAAGKGEPGQTCFLFSHLLSQDQWFEISRAGSAKAGSESQVYWLSIAALYDPAAEGPAHLWTWKIRATASDAAGAVVETIVPPLKITPWPPTLGAQWDSGSVIRDRQFNPLDMAFQLTTFVPLELEPHASAEQKSGAVIDHEELAMLAAGWLNAAR